jgi:hypothetical protein
MFSLRFLIEIYHFFTMEIRPIVILLLDYNGYIYVIYLVILQLVVNCLDYKSHHLFENI